MRYTTPKADAPKSQKPPNAQQTTRAQRATRQTPTRISIKYPHARVVTNSNGTAGPTAIRQVSCSPFEELPARKC